MTAVAERSDPVRIISVFNNKGGVGKTTLTFHLAHALAELGHRVLLVDLDPQCNLTVYCIDVDELRDIWQAEDAFIESFDATRKQSSSDAFHELLSQPRTAHFLLRPTEEGTGEIGKLSMPFRVARNLDLLPGRLTLHNYEDKIAGRWSDAYQGDALAIRTITRPRTLIREYASDRGYDIAIVDTSPSLGVLNKVAISTVDGFIVPCMPDMFSLYGIRNIGDALGKWKRQFDTMYSLISDQKRSQFPAEFVKFLGYMIYNARRYANTNDWDLSKAHMHYAEQIPAAVQRYIPQAVRHGLSPKDLTAPIGGTAVMHSHNTLPAMAQKYRLPIWRVPDGPLENGDKSTVGGNRHQYEQTRVAYHDFARDVLSRIDRQIGPRQS